LSLYILDTDTVSLYRRGNARIRENLLVHSSDELAISVITVEEMLSGWYGRLRKVNTPEKVTEVYHNLAQTIYLLANFTIVNFNEGAQSRFDILKKEKLSVGPMDLRIAAIALENNAIVITANTRDFERVPGLQFEDCTV
jgi:tRNA(fMet)-specific endonuclease VapC